MSIVRHQENLSIAANDSHKRAIEIESVAPFPVVSLRGVSKTFRSVAVVGNVSFELQRGEILALLGPS